MGCEVETRGVGQGAIAIGEDRPSGRRQGDDEGALRQGECARKTPDEGDHDLIRLQHRPRLSDQILKRLAISVS